MTNISPTSGSKNGGTLVSIEGINFSETFLDNVVYIGNKACVVESATTTLVKCRTAA